ncbi:unnamed protein product [Nippostrongylus brasiliensis]|uniref:Orange domain-containing protein n=1 Tax=Nippostrongylus brasiliensis TaxID=27835 RepID=A0A158QXL9_NIPBR|nr:unnamed protein product [Nippostrongylus brasiliensis]
MSLLRAAPITKNTRKVNRVGAMTVSTESGSDVAVATIRKFVGDPLDRYLAQRGLVKKLIANDNGSSVYRAVCEAEELLFQYRMDRLRNGLPYVDKIDDTLRMTAELLGYCALSTILYELLYIDVFKFSKETIKESIRKVREDMDAVGVDVDTPSPGEQPYAQFSFSNDDMQACVASAPDNSSRIIFVNGVYRRVSVSDLFPFPEFVRRPDSSSRTGPAPSEQAPAAPQALDLTSNPGMPFRFEYFAESFSFMYGYHGVWNSSNAGAMPAGHPVQYVNSYPWPPGTAYIPADAVPSTSWSSGYMMYLYEYGNVCVFPYNPERQQVNTSPRYDFGFEGLWKDKD